VRGGKAYSVLLVLAPSLLNAQVSNAASEPLADIVGTWQSDTVGGTTARSVCVWSPQGRGVICEQAITTPGGIRHTLNAFVADSGNQNFFYYGISQPGEDVPATFLEIRGHVWVYGGRRKASDGLYHHTINDFTAMNGSYVWRQEFSRDGIQWTVQRQGRAVKQRF